MVCIELAWSGKADEARDDADHVVGGGAASAPSLTQGENEFAAFYEVEHPRLLRRLIIEGFDRTIAQEAAADAMLSAYQQWSQLNSPAIWVRQRARWKAVDAWRRLRKEDLVADVTDAQIGYQMPKDDMSLLTGLLEALPQRQRHAMVLMITGFSYSEIADVMRTSESSVRSAIRHARRTLRYRLEDARDAYEADSDQEKLPGQAS